MNIEFFVISLKCALQRRKQVAESLAAEGVNWQFFDAIKGDDLTEDRTLFDVEKCMKFPGYPLRDNEIACFLSHREIWKKCFENNSCVVVLEDDVVVEPMFQGGVGEALRKIDISTIEVLRLGNGSYRNQKKKIYDYGDFSAFRYREDPLCALGYILTPKGAEKLLKHSQKFYLAVDNYIWRSDIHDALVLDVYPHIFKAMDGNQSTIGDRSKPKQNILKKISIEFYRALDRRAQKRYENRLFNSIK